MSELRTIAQFLLCTIIAGTSFWMGFQIAARLLHPTSLRWVGAIIIQCWILVALFHLLAVFGLFQLPIALGFLLLLSLAASRLKPADGSFFGILREDLRKIASLFRTLASSPYRWVFAAAVVIVTIRFLRSLLAPPLGWDALTYHLPKATLWIQQGGYATLPGPAANTYYNYFQSGGDIMWAWAMLPGSDMLLGTAGFLIWTALVAALYAATRMFQADPSRGALIALCLASIPVVLQYFSAAYVDILLMLYLVSALLFLAHWQRTGSKPLAVLAAASLGLAAATKITGILFAAAGAAFMVYFLSSGKTANNRIGLLFVCLLAVSVGAPDYVKAWIETGSPTYPFEIKLGSQILFAGNKHLADLHSGLLHQKEMALGGFEYFKYLFFTSVAPWGHLNFGGGGLILLLLGLWGAIQGLRRPELRTMTILVIAFFIIGIIPLLPASSAIYHTKLWAPIVGRLFLPAFGLVILLAGIVEGRWFFPFWTATTVINLYLSFPTGLGRIDLLAFADLLPWLAAGLLVLVAAVYARRKLANPRLTFALFVLAVLIPVMHLGDVRAKFRYRYYQASADLNDPVFDLHQLNPFYASAWPLWQYFDIKEEKRLAVTAGWDGIGHNWYWQPLFGSSCQNEVSYIPITTDGSLPDITDWPALRKNADFPSWLSRIADSQTNALVLLGPRTIESEWVGQHSFLFSQLAESPNKGHAAYRIDSSAVRGFLAADTCVHHAQAVPPL